jgi:hypothetical protein
MNKVILLFVWCFISVFIQKRVFSQSIVLLPDNYRHYVDSFNLHDNEIYKGFIPNDKSWEFLSDNIPLLDCPDKTIEQTYYFRWWTYRKHIKLTPDGFVITEFLPDVPWAGKYNTISCPASFHFYEGRWLHNQKFLNDYGLFWFRSGGSLRTYSFWPADALYNYYLVTNNDSLCKELLPDIIENYNEWGKEKYDSIGLYWQADGNDGMEMSICGSGYRATINSYMYGEAAAISRIALLPGDKEMSAQFSEKSKALKRVMQNKLWDRTDNFLKVLPREKEARLCATRELHGYTPWYFNIPDNEYSAAWKFLMDPKCFYAPYGPTSAEQSDPGFKISYEGHECQWNGPSWPYATSITLTGLANLLNNYSQNIISGKDYFELLKIYAGSHKLITDNGKTVPWIDENLNPFTGDWISRTRLKTWKDGNWSDEKGGVERGKDYNHSTFCDLIISGLIGIRPQTGNTLIVNPLLPDKTWKYFCLDNVLYHGKIITVLYDETGMKYKRGKGFFILVNGKTKASSKTIKKVNIDLN